MTNAWPILQGMTPEQRAQYRRDVATLTRIEAQREQWHPVPGAKRHDEIVKTEAARVSKPA